MLIEVEPPARKQAPGPIALLKAKVATLWRFPRRAARTAVRFISSYTEAHSQERGLPGHSIASASDQKAFLTLSQ